MQRVSLRLGRDGDLAAMARVHQASVRGLCKDHYEPHEIERWTAVDPGLYARLLRHSTVFIATRGRVVVGFAAVSIARREVRAVYVAPSAAGGGVGGRLLQRIERLARALGVRTLHLAATLNAVSFYERLGWTLDEACPTPANYRCVAMCKRISGAGGVRKRSVS